MTVTPALRPAGEPAPAVPLFFGESDRPLFGCYTAAAVSRQTNLGFVFCAPVGAEYSQTHRAVRVLATRLSALGFAGLRFDYGGCGDSAGSAEESRLRDWLADVATAVDELKRRGVARICLVGLRLGAALAALGAAEHCDADGLILWDPVLDGRSYLGELEEQQRGLLREVGIRDELPSGLAAQIDVLGFRLSEDLRRDIERIDLTTGNTRRVAREALIVESGAVVVAEPLAAALERLGTIVTRRHLPGPAFWLQPEGALVPQRVLQEITTWSAETFA